MISKVKTLWQILQQKAKYMTAIIAAKEGICVKKFVIKLGVVHSGIILWRYIVRQYYQHVLTPKS
jgi:hypothetical protein